MIRLSSAAMIRLSSAATILLAGATLLVLLYVTAGRNVAGVVIGLPSDPSRLFRSGDDDSVGTRCAVLIAGSKGYGNYRHQVKKRTAKDNTAYGSHVMQFGDIGLSKENLFLYMGTNSPFVDDNCLRPPQKGVDLDQQDANLLYFWLEVSLSLVTNCVCHAHYSRPRHGHLPGNTHPNAAGVRAQLGLFQCLRLHALDLSHGTTGC